MAGSKWTPAEVAEMTRLHGEGKSDRAIAEELGRERQAVTQRRIRQNLPPNRIDRHLVNRKQVPDDFLQYAWADYPELMVQYDCSKNVIARWRKELGIVKRGPKREAKPKPIIVRKARPAGQWGLPQPAAVPMTDGSLAALAQAHLQRIGFKPVARVEYTALKGRAPSGHYVVGHYGVMAPTDMIAFAQARKFEVRA